MANTIEKPAETTTTEHVEEKKAEKEPTSEPEPTTTDTTETTETNETTTDINHDGGNGHTGEENGNGHTEECTSVHVESSNVDDVEEKDEATLKRKDVPADTTDESTKKQKLVDSEEKEAEPTATTVEV